MEDAFLMSLQTFHADNDVLGGLCLCAGDVQHFTCVSPVTFTTTLALMFLLSPVCIGTQRGWVVCPCLHSWGFEGLYNNLSITALLRKELCLCMDLRGSF